MKQLQLLIKPASSMCDLCCEYCFYKDEAAHRETQCLGIMKRNTREALIRNALSSAQECVFAFQGGEPVLAGLEWFREFVRDVEAVKTPGQNIQYTLQTNGMQIREDWLDFLKENNFLVGLSLDGTEEIHNEYRKNNCGQGTFTQVYKTAKKIQKKGIELNILTVLTGESSKRVEEIYNFFKREGFLYQQYIPCLDPIEKTPGAFPYSIQPEEYGEALKTLFDLWFRDTVRGESVFIRQFENWMMLLTGAGAEACSMCGQCTMQNVIEADGSVYPCDFYALDRYLVGNVKDTAFEELQIKAEGMDFLKNARQRGWECEGCRYYPLCRGGCRRDVFFDGEKHYQYFCEAYRSFFQYALYKMEWLLAK